MRYKLTYNMDKTLKIKTLRYLRSLNLNFERTTFIVDIPEEVSIKDMKIQKGSIIEKLVTKLENTLEPLNDDTNNGYTIGFSILNRLFLKAIAEKNPEIIKFIRKLLTKKEGLYLESLSTSNQLTPEEQKILNELRSES